MKLDGAIFAIEQRSVGDCIDLAVVFVREHLFKILQLLLWFAVPSTALTWWLVARCDWTLSTCLVLFLFECPFFGAALVAASGQRVFGERFSPSGGFRSLVRRLPFYFVVMMGARLATVLLSFLMIFPGYMVATRYGFLAEILLLEGCPARKYETRLSDLMDGHYWNLLRRLTLIASFFSMTVLSLFLLVDLSSATLFGVPILAGRVSQSGDMYDEHENFAGNEFMTLLTRDPRVATVLVAILWLVYPVTRLAWLFCYLDVRIRKEAWDIELDFKAEAKRLEATS